MKTRTNYINWQLDSYLLELDRNEEYIKDSFKWIEFEYRGKKLLAEIEYYIGYSNQYEAETGYKWEEIYDCQVTIQRLTDEDEVDFYLSPSEMHIIETELSNDLKNQY